MQIRIDHINDGGTTNNTDGIIFEKKCEKLSPEFQNVGLVARVYSTRVE